MHVLPDSILLDICGHFSAVQLASACLVSKSLYCFATYEDLWKALVINEFEGRFSWGGTWKETYARTKHLGSCHGVDTPGGPDCKPLKVEGFYSDLLYQPWFCATMELLPEWIEEENIERRMNLSVEEFLEHFERPNKPVVITDAASM